jgi:putative transposase
VGKLPVRLVEREDTALLDGLPDELRLAMTDVAAAAREGLLAMSVAIGLRVVGELLDAEMTATCGPKHAKQADRAARRHGSAPGSLVLGGRRVPVDRPRARTLDGREVQLQAWQAFCDDDPLAELVMERMLAGLATRRHAQAAEPVGAAVEQAARATSKSAVSRRFVAQTAKALEELLARDLGELRVACLLLDGIHVAERCCVVALAICADGRKVPVGLWEGSTENATVVRHLLADLQGRGLDATRGLLVVIDGAKALATAVRSVFGELALVQRCTVHKRRNVTEHLPEADRGRVDARLARAFADPDPAKGLRSSGAGRRTRAGPPWRGGQPAGGARGDVHPAPARRGRPARQDPVVDQSGGVDDLGRPHDRPQRPSAGGMGRWCGAGWRRGCSMPSGAFAVSRVMRRCRCWWQRWPVTPRRWVSG